MAPVISGAIIAICASVLTVRVPEWWVVWADVVASEENNFNKVNELNPRLELVTHLAAGFFVMFKSPSLASLAGYVIWLPILARALFSRPATQHDDPRETYLRQLAIIAMVSLLVVYHRFYSVVFLVFPVVWAEGVHSCVADTGGADWWVHCAHIARHHRTSLPHGHSNRNRYWRCAFRSGRFGMFCTVGVEAMSCGARSGHIMLCSECRACNPVTDIFCVVWLARQVYDM